MSRRSQNESLSNQSTNVLFLDRTKLLATRMLTLMERQADSPLWGIGDFLPLVPASADEIVAAMRYLNERKLVTASITFPAITLYFVRESRRGSCA